MKDADWPLYEITLLEPEQAVVPTGRINLICLLETEVMSVTVFPHTEILKPYLELIGKPAPAIVASTPPPGLVWAGENVFTVRAIDSAVRAELSANPILVTWTTGFALPAGKATELSAFLGSVQVKLEIVPVGEAQGTPRYVTVT